MKKLIISMFALAAVLVSCSKSAVVEVPYENIPISFSSYNGKTPTVKSTSFAGLDSLSKYGFQVYGYLKNTADATPSYAVGSEYMNKKVTATQGEDQKWNWGYEGVSYWPGTLFLDFVAYGLNAGNVLAADQTNSNILAVTIPEKVAEQKDVLVAVPHKSVQYSDQGEGANNGVVALNFKHLLSRVSFGLVTKDKNPVYVTMEKIELKGMFNTTGSIDLTLVDEGGVPYIKDATPAADSTAYDYLGGGSYTSTGTTTGDDIYDNSMLWSKYTGDESTKNDDVYQTVDPGEDADQTEKDAYANKVAQANKNKENRYMMIMPTTAQQHGAKLYITYFLPSAGSYNVTVADLSQINFEAGKSYKFLLKVSTNAISFSVEVTDWVDGTVTDIIDLN